MNATSNPSKEPLELSFSDSATDNSSKALPTWVQRVQAVQQNDQRVQPWKETLGNTHDKGDDGEDLINLQLPNHVQCGSLAG